MSLDGWIDFFFLFLVYWLVGRLVGWLARARAVYTALEPSVVLRILIQLHLGCVVQMLRVVGVWYRIAACTLFGLYAVCVMRPLTVISCITTKWRRFFLAFSQVLKCVFRNFVAFYWFFRRYCRRTRSSLVYSVFVAAKHNTLGFKWTWHYVWTWMRWLCDYLCMWCICVIQFVAGGHNTKTDFFIWSNTYRHINGNTDFDIFFWLWEEKMKERKRK